MQCIHMSRKPDFKWRSYTRATMFCVPSPFSVLNEEGKRPQYLPCKAESSIVIPDGLQLFANYIEMLSKNNCKEGETSNGLSCLLSFGQLLSPTKNCNNGGSTVFFLMYFPHNSQFPPAFHYKP